MTQTVDATHITHLTLHIIAMPVTFIFLYRPAMNIETKVMDSKIHGRGVVATAFIPKDTLVWSYSHESCNTFSAGELVQRLAVLSSDDARDLLWGGYYHQNSDCFIHIRDKERFKNHGPNPNCGGPAHALPTSEACYAIRDIQAGEELVDDYRTFASVGCPWLVELLGQYCPDRLSFEQSIASTPSSIAQENPPMLS
jgi:hypothetical protein